MNCIPTALKALSQALLCGIALGMVASSRSAIRSQMTTESQPSGERGQRAATRPSGLTATSAISAGDVTSSRPVVTLTRFTRPPIRINSSSETKAKGLPSRDTSSFLGVFFARSHTPLSTATRKPLGTEYDRAPRQPVDFPDILAAVRVPKS